MNKLSFVLALVALVTSVSANAAILGAPFIPEIDARFNLLEKISGYPAVSTGDVTCLAGACTIQPGKVTGPDLASLAGQSGSSATVLYKAILPMTAGGFGSIGSKNTSIVLPANTIIRQAWFQIFTALTQASGGTVAFQCDSSNDIFSATDETGASSGAIIAGVETGTAATMHFSSAGCTVAAVVATHAASAGEIDLFIEAVTTH